MLKVDTLEAGKMGEWEDLCDRDKDQIAMAKIYHIKLGKEVSEVDDPVTIYSKLERKHFSPFEHATRFHLQNIYNTHLI